MGSGLLPPDPDPQEEIDWLNANATPAYETADDNDEACLSCEDTGWIVTPAGWKIPCSDCPTGELNFYHEREKTIAEMVHVDELLPGVDPEYEEGA